MKLKELKHNHSLTDLLKILIFSILMITPLLSVATRCLYVICNKNAYQSAEIENTYQTYSINYEYETNEVNNINDIENDNIYKVEYDTGDLVLSGNFLTRSIYKLELSSENDTAIYDNLQISLYKYQSNYFRVVNSSTHTAIWVVNDNLETITTVFSFSKQTYTHIRFYFIAVDNENVDYSAFLSYISISDFLGQESVNIENHTGTTLDNVFEYSVNKLAESPILSWTQQTAIYTGVSTMTTQLGVSTPTIPMLIVYWFLLTVIYIIIDIIIKLFTWLTHMIGSKSV